jgi:hypothetical protein
VEAIAFLCAPLQVLVFPMLSIFIKLLSHIFQRHLLHLLVLQLLLRLYLQLLYHRLLQHLLHHHRTSPQLLPVSPVKANASPAAALDVTPSTVLATRAQQGRTRPTARTAYSPAVACALPASSALKAPLNRASAQAARRQAKAPLMHPSALPSHHLSCLVL